MSPGVEFKAETPIMMDATVFLLFHASVLTKIRKTIEGYLEAFPEELKRLKQRRKVVEITVWKSFHTLLAPAKRRFSERERIHLSYV